LSHSQTHLQQLHSDRGLFADVPSFGAESLAV
jgi:hypothetical protein